MKKAALAFLTLGLLGFVLAGCQVGEVSESQQKAKIKAMDDIAKTDPNYQAKQAQRAQRG